MKPTKGYYCVIQYCPDLSRLEAANIGVLLFCPEIDFLEARTDEAASRIRRFFGLKSEERWYIDSLRASIEGRLKTEKQYFQTLEDLERFIATRANSIKITAPRPMKVSDPQKDLETLFEQLVEVPARKHQAAPSESIKEVLSKAFKDESIKRKIKRDVRIDVPEFRQVRAPYAYKNGDFNLIQPVRFEDKKDEAAFKEACFYAIEGEYISGYQHPDYGDMRLIVVGQFSPEQQATKAIVDKMFTERKVSLFTQADLDELLRDIAEHGKELAA